MPAHQVLHKYDDVVQMCYDNFQMKPKSQTSYVLANNHWIMINFHNICNPTLTNG